jgi:hypothetical protein
VAALADEEVFGALILGPKIGNGFLLNLNGVYSQFTMDRWWSRMWGRLTGTLIIDKSKQVKKNRVRLRKGLAKLRAEERTLVESIVGSIEVDTDRDIDKVARAIFRAASTQALLPPLKVTPRVAEVRKAANTLVDNLLFERETPQHNTERAIMKQVGLRALVEIAKRSGYTKLAPADYQALLWYPEKRLYETAAKGVKVSGYDKDSAPNYANAARDYAREQTIADDAIRAALDREEAKNRERRPAAAAGRAGTLRPGVRGRFRPGARPQPGAVRRFAQRGGVEEVRSLEDTGEFYQAPASATLAGFYSRLTLPVRDAKVDKAKGRDWAAIIKAAKTGINLDEYRAVGVQALEEQGADETFTRDEVLAFLKANEIHLETVELANPDELIDPALLDRKKREYLHALVEDQMDLAREEDRAPRMWTEADLLVEEDPEGGWVVSVDGESIPDRWTTHDSEGDAEIAGREWIEEQNETTERNWRDEIANGLDWDAIDEEVRRTLREQYRDREAQYASWVLPGGRDGTYREVFVTAPDAGAGGLAEAQRRILDAAIARLQAQPDLTADGAFARDMLRRVRETGDYRVKRGDFVMLSGWENEVLRAAVPYPEGDGRGTVQGFVHEATLTNLPTNWEDGHPGYEHIVNPIVRLRFNVRSVRREDGHLDTVLFLEEVQPPARH